MITSNGKKSTTSTNPVTLLDESGPRDGVLSLWTRDEASGAGKLIVNGGEIAVDAGAFSFQTSLYVGKLLVQIQRSGAADMTGWQATLSTRSGT